MEKFLKNRQSPQASIHLEAERERYCNLGEISGLVAHDLIGPLHAAQFWLDEIDELRMTRQEYRRLERVKTNLGHALDLAISLRARLKNPDQLSQFSSLKEAHFHVIRLLETQLGQGALGKVEIQLDPKLENVILEIPRIELIQILDNIYRNSIKDLVENRIVPAFIRLSRGPVMTGEVCILISDNGSGLTAAKFNRMIGYPFTQQENTESRGLGLRLTKRLVEFHGGTLSLLESKDQGTTFELRLKSAQNIVKGLPFEMGEKTKESVYAILE